VSEQFLVRKRGLKPKAHYWNDGDTLCRMASTGGLKLSRYSLRESNDGKEICWMCLQRKEPRLDRHAMHEVRC
jgi:hypothetical protein